MGWKHTLTFQCQQKMYACYARTKLNSNQYFPMENPSEKLLHKKGECRMMLLLKKNKPKTEAS